LRYIVIEIIIKSLEKYINIVYGIPKRRLNASLIACEDHLFNIVEVYSLLHLQIDVCTNGTYEESELVGVFLGFKILLISKTNREKTFNFLYY
jgi:hypothetical protein